MFLKTFSDFFHQSFIKPSHKDIFCLYFSQPISTRLRLKSKNQLIIRQFLSRTID